MRYKNLHYYVILVLGATSTLTNSNLKRQSFVRQSPHPNPSILSLTSLSELCANRCLSPHRRLSLHPGTLYQAFRDKDLARNMNLHNFSYKVFDSLKIHQRAFGGREGAHGTRSCNLGFRWVRFKFKASVVCAPIATPNADCLPQNCLNCLKKFG